MKYQIHVSGCPAPAGPYSIGTTAARHIYTSGILAWDEDGGLMAGGAREQAERIVDLLSQVLAEVSLELDDVAKLTVFVTSMDAMGAVDEVLEERFSLPMPARSVACVSELPLGALVQMDAVAVR